MNQTILMDDQALEFLKNSEISGIKFDQEKLPMHLFPKDAMDAVVEILAFGKDKYGAWNWMNGLEWTRLYDACLRHLLAWNDGENLDEESKKNHIAHAACNLVFLLTFIKKEIGTDDRRKSNKG